MLLSQSHTPCALDWHIEARWSAAFVKNFNKKKKKITFFQLFSRLELFNVCMHEMNSKVTHAVAELRKVMRRVCEME